jgi:hypothetical protein
MNRVSSVLEIDNAIGHPTIFGGAALELNDMGAAVGGSLTFSNSPPLYQLQAA